MNGEKLPLTKQNIHNGFYTGEEVSTEDVGTSGISRKILHSLTIISVLIACGCTTYGSLQSKSAAFLLPLVVVLVWLCMHFLLLYFIRNEKHDFHPPAWFVFVSSGHIFIQSLIVIILTFFKKQN